MWRACTLCASSRSEREGVRSQFRCLYARENRERCGSSSGAWREAQEVWLGLSILERSQWSEGNVGRDRPLRRWHLRRSRKDSWSGEFSAPSAMPPTPFGDQARRRSLALGPALNGALERASVAPWKQARANTTTRQQCRRATQKHVHAHSSRRAVARHTHGEHVPDKGRKAKHTAMRNRPMKPNLHNTGTAAVVNSHISDMRACERADASRRGNTWVHADVLLLPGFAVYMAWRAARAPPCVDAVLAASRGARRPALRCHGGHILPSP